MTDNTPVSREEFDRIEEQLEKLQDMVGDLHKGLFEPPMEGGDSLIKRMKTVTEEIETGKRGIRAVIWFLGFLAALGVSIKFGFDATGGGGP